MQQVNYKIYTLHFNEKTTNENEIDFDIKSTHFCARKTIHCFQMDVLMTHTAVRHKQTIEKL